MIKVLSKEIILHCLLLGTLLFYGAPGTGVFILCMGENGHIAIEDRTDGCCNESSEHHDHDEPGQSDCGDCVDLPVSPDSGVLPSPGSSLDGPDPAGLACHVPVHGVSAETQRDVIPEAIPPPSWTACLRTVILLI